MKRTFRPFLMAKSKANRAIRSDLNRVMILSDSTTPGKDCGTTRVRFANLCEMRKTDLMFKTRVFTLRVFSNNGKVDVGVSGGETRDGFAENEGGVDVELLSHGYVPGGVARSLDGGVENTWSMTMVMRSGTEEHGVVESYL